jgi:hypothetical protein
VQSLFNVPPIVPAVVIGALFLVIVKVLPTQVRRS